ncbi:uncharacterized protein LOC136091693 [Hydra vulgaris]|uniref:Uncharacterized protein LOC136091693 n=1 Tax=Hydra vulgaris TaxID=6087 RepID=A0ABM4DLQ5_HYDVU
MKSYKSGIQDVGSEFRRTDVQGKRLYEKELLEFLGTVTVATEISRIGNKNLVFLDETGFNQHTKRRYGYSPLNIKAFVAVPANKSVNKSLICAIDYNGIIGYKYRTGSYNGTEFINFISVLAPYFASHPNSILIMDNARIHKTHEVQRVLSSFNIPFKFIVPYSPELNPIEEFFSMFKSRYCAIRRANPTLTIEQCLDLVASSDNDYSLQCHRFYENMKRWVEKAQNGEQFI